MPFAILNREVPTLHAAALILGAAAFVSKLLGLLRDRLLASRFGAGEELDVYYAAFHLPDIIYTLFLAGAASAAVLPTLLSYYRQRGPRAADEFLGNLLTVFAASAALVALAVMLFTPQLLAVVAPGFGPEKLDVASGLTRIMLANAVFLGIAGILSSVLQARHRFFVFALPPVVYNLGIIAGILFIVPRVGVYGLALGVLLGGLLQVIVQLPSLFALGFRLRPRFNLTDAGLRQVLRTSLPRVAALSMSQVTLTALTAIASFFAAGSISVFRLAVNLLYVPVGLFGVSWALALFPKLSDASLAGAGETFRSEFAIGARSILFWSLPIAALAVVLRAHIVRVALGAGVFDWADTRLVAAALAVLAVAIVSESLLPLLLRAFYALGRTREPLFWDVFSSVFTVAVALGTSAFFVSRPAALSALAAILRIGDLPEPWILSVAIAFALGSLLNAALLAVSLRRLVWRQFGIRLSLGQGGLAAMTGAALLAGALAYLALRPFPSLVATNTFIGIFLQGAVAGVVGLAAYAAILAASGNPEIRGIWASICGRLISPRRVPRVYEAEKLDGEGTK